jgi:hypothetical protein
MRFSQRIGIQPVKEIIQKDKIDDDLRNSLWNAIYFHYLNNLPTYKSSIKGVSYKYIYQLWIQFFKKPIDEIPGKCTEIVKYIKDWFYNAKWWGIYDLIDFTAEFDYENNNSDFEKVVNIFLKQELSAYSFINHKLVQITSAEEINEIQDILDRTESSALSNVRSHFVSSLDKLSDRINPDYRNSIKESISAVEAIVRIISGDKKAELGKALKIIEDRVGLHKSLKNGFSAIYGYTSDDDGIRHALTQDSKCDQEDAKYMLVSCSAFVNYLIVKAEKSGITIL